MEREGKPGKGTNILEGMSWVRAFAACQALMVPTKMYRVTHKRAREVIRQELGFCPKGKPGTERESKYNHGFRDGGADAIHEWLGINAIIHQRSGDMGVAAGDRTAIHFGAAA